jgi:hypothetical protein
VKDELAAVQRRIAAAAEAGELDQARAPMLEALDAYRRSDPASFSIPAHKTGRSLDEETLGDPRRRAVPRRCARPQGPRRPRRIQDRHGR